MKNYKLKIQYDGTAYAGWQVQKNAETIQERLINSVKLVTGEEVNLIGSGRTDAGVHALGQIANFKSEIEYDLFKLKHSLNAVLPQDISVISMEKTYEDFHARFDAKKRTYIYLFSKYKSPFWGKYSYRFYGELKCPELNLLSGYMLGRKDYTSFSRKNSDTKNKICTVYSMGWRETGNLVIFKIEADRFLHGMVRTIVGTLLKTSRMGLGPYSLEEIFSARDRTAAGEAVPPNGLFLFKVKY